MISAERVRKQADAFHAESIRVRRHLHMHPELSFSEKETAAFIAGELRAAGIEHTVGVAEHGIVATIGVDGAGIGRDAVALRADMDALPIHEVDDRPYRSKTNGVMHACGHDGHMACLLTAAWILASLQEELSGTVKLIFQPAEERAPGGAQRMIDAGVLESPRVSRVFGQHVNTDLPAGSVGFASGLFMASADEIYITVRGRGGHAAKPHRANDPVVIASTLVVALQQLVSRNADPIVPSVLTFGRFVGDGAANVIPDSVELAATFRTMDETWRGEALDRLHRTTTDLARSLGAEADVRIVPGYPAVVNDPDATAFARSRAVEYLGDDRVVDLPPVMWAEDFAFYGRRRPSCFYNLGVRNDERGIVHPVHTARFDIEEDALRFGSGLLAWIGIGAVESGSS